MSTHKVADLCLHIECEDDALDAKVQNVVRDMLYLDGRVSCRTVPDIRLFFRYGTTGHIHPEDAREIYSSPALRVLTNDAVSFVFAKGASFRLDLVHSEGTAFIDDRFWDNPFKTIQECVVLSLLWMLHSHSVYAIHANCLEKDGAGILCVGTSGSGKSTTGFSLIRSGWNYLSDDVNLIRTGRTGLALMAFQKGYSIDPDMVRHYPEIGNHLDASFPNGRKRILDMEALCPEQFTYRTVPRLILFPRITHQQESTLTPMNKATALVRLAENSGGIMVNRSMASAQMDTLKRLVDRTGCYQLLCGRDVLERPQDFVHRVSRLLRGLPQRDEGGAII